MFDLIDDLAEDVWADKGSPPNDLAAIDDFSEYENCQIVHRKPDEGKKEIVYVVTDDEGTTPKHVILRGAKIKDPLKNVRHFYAKLINVDEPEGYFEVQTVLLDMDWCVKK